MKLEIGKTYRMRDGTPVTIKRIDSPGPFALQMDHNYALNYPVIGTVAGWTGEICWTEEGKFYKDQEHPYDLTENVGDGESNGSCDALRAALALADAVVSGLDESDASCSMLLISHARRVGDLLREALGETE